MARAWKPYTHGHAATSQARLPSPLTPSHTRPYASAFKLRSSAELVTDTKRDNTPGPKLKDLLQPGELLIAPGVFDGISLRVAQKVGFQALYMTGWSSMQWRVASRPSSAESGTSSWGIRWQFTR